MRKELDEPALEVADFIMHALGRQARKNLTERRRLSARPEVSTKVLQRRHPQPRLSSGTAFHLRGDIELE
jgi:hypothetical protein